QVPPAPRLCPDDPRLLPRAGPGDHRTGVTRPEDGGHGGPAHDPVQAEEQGVQGDPGPVRRVAGARRGRPAPGGGLMSKMTDKLGGARRAGRGVGPRAAAEAQAPPPAGSNLYAGTRALGEARAIPVDRIAADPDQPRRGFEPEKLAELGISMKRRG